MRFTLDTNVLLYAHDRREAQRRETALHLIDSAAGADCVLLAQCLGEFFNVATARFRISMPDATAAVLKWGRAFPVQAAGESTLALAMELTKTQRLSFWDAMIVAAAREAECNVLLSEDMNDGQVVVGVEVVNPFNPANTARLDEILGVV